MPPVQQTCRTRGVGEYVAGERHVIWWYRLDPQIPGARTGLLVAHGLLGTADSGVNDPTTFDIINRTTMQGVPCMTADLGGPATWGNNLAKTRMGQALTFLGSTVGAKTDRVVLAGFSMGGTLALNWARDNPGLVAGIALFAPAVDLADIYDNDRMGLASSIDAAYAGEGGWPANEATANPANFAANYTDIPIRIWYSTDDPLIIPSIVENWAADAGATLTSLGNVGHSINGIDTLDVAQSMAQYANV